MAQGIPFAQIVDDLRKLCREQSTGMVFITTDDNQLAQASLENGNIVYLFFSKHRGEEALQALRQVKAGHMRFTPGTIPAFRSPLPAASEVLDYLQGSAGQQPSSPVAAPSAPQQTVGSGLSEQEKAILVEELTELIGPMAAIVCQDDLEDAQDLNTAMDTLCRSLSDPAQKENFKNNVLRRVQG